MFSPDLEEYLFHGKQPAIKKSTENKLPHPHDKPAIKKSAEIEFSKKYRLNRKTDYNFLSWNSNPTHLNYYSFNVYITPKEKTNFTFRNIFDDSEIIFKKTPDVKKWLESPNLSFWAQALNFAVWCATGGCGVSREMLTSASPQVDSFYKFHVYFTIRRILNELQCPLPKDRHFSKFNNYYNKNAFEKLKTEFSTGNDFRYHGSTEVFNAYYWSYGGLDHDKYIPNKIYQLPDEWATTDHMNHFNIEYVSDPKMKYQYEYFFPSTSMGLTKAGLSRINQSIEAFVYCILGSQVQTRSSIIGDSGSAQETQKVFLQLFESSVVESDISKSIQRYQFALQKAKQKLDLAVALGCWLCPSYLVLNNSPIVGYNNKLQKATENMKIGVNNINEEIIPIVKHNLGPSKKNQPEEKPTPPIEEKHEPVKKYPKPKIEKHENNKAAIIIVIAGVAWSLFR